MTLDHLSFEPLGGASPSALYGVEGWRCQAGSGCHRVLPKPIRQPGMKPDTLATVSTTTPRGYRHKAKPMAPTQGSNPGRRLGVGHGVASPSFHQGFPWLALLPRHQSLSKSPPRTASRIPSSSAPWSSRSSWFLTTRPFRWGLFSLPSPPPRKPAPAAWPRCNLLLFGHPQHFAPHLFPRGRIVCVPTLLPLIKTYAS